MCLRVRRCMIYEPRASMPRGFHRLVVDAEASAELSLPPNFFLREIPLLVIRITICAGEGGSPGRDINRPAHLKAKHLEIGTERPKGGQVKCVHALICPKDVSDEKRGVELHEVMLLIFDA